MAVSGLSNAVAIAAGNAHTCALLSDGTARCWGWNGRGQLGNGTSSGPEMCGGLYPCSRTPVLVSGLSDAVAITVGGVHTCALLSNGSAKCWGLNTDGQLGDGTQTGTVLRLTPVAVSGLSNAVAIVRRGRPHLRPRQQRQRLVLGQECHRAVGGRYGDAAARPGGRVRQRVWGRAAAAGSTLSGVVAIAAGYTHTCALLSDGSARCWGSNANGQLGDNTTTERHTPVAVQGLAYALAPAIAAGGYHTCALLGDGTARCWGQNDNGQLGDNSTTQRLTPVAVSGLSNAVAISAGLDHTCAVLSDGTARCWGHNSDGRLGDGTTTERHTPVAVCASGSGPGCGGGAALTGVVAIAAGDTTPAPCSATAAPDAGARTATASWGTVPRYEPPSPRWPSPA